MSLERVEAVNPIYGMRIVDKYDPYPCGYSENALIGTLNRISESRHDYDMLLECASFEEVDAYYNPGLEKITEDFILEAIVVDKFSKTERRMAAVVRVMNKHLGDSEINALAPIVGKPKKAGSYAYVTVQLPFSDGQVVSVIFHAPEGDKKKIGPSDQIIAFRWLLNKRDITQIVAPEDGSEISLEAIAKRITQLVAKNSARFERTQKEAQAERQELEKAKEDLKEAQARQEELIQNMETSSKDNETLAAQLSNTLALLEKQKTTNAELQAKLDALRKSTSATGGSAGTRNTGGNGSKSAGTQPKNIEIYSKEIKFNKGKTEITFTITNNLPSGTPTEGYRIVCRSKTPGMSTITTTLYENGEWGGVGSTPSGWKIKYFATPQDAETVAMQNAASRGLTGNDAGTNTGTASKTDNPEYVVLLNDILSGKYDNDPNQIDAILDKAAEQAEKDGTFEQYEDLFNQAADYLTVIFKKKQEAA